jgi:hypothetical protein
MVKFEQPAVYDHALDGTNPSHPEDLFFQVLRSTGKKPLYGASLKIQDK